MLALIKHQEKPRSCKAIQRGAADRRHKVLETTDRCTKHCSQPAQRPLSHGWAASRLLYMKRAELTFEARTFIGEEVDGQDVYDVPPLEREFPEINNHLDCTAARKP